MMNQGYSGSTVQRKGRLVEKVSSDQEFIQSPERQRDLLALSRKVSILPCIDHIAGPSIFMEYIEGQEGLTAENAQQAGKALRLLHDQPGYPHLCMTGLPWLIDLANETLARINDTRQIPLAVASQYPGDALIHSEPVQLIEKKDGSIVFIDIEQMGLGSRYQDLGFIYYHALLNDQPGQYPAFLQGYRQSELPAPLQIEHRRVEQVAGIISLAYTGFALAFAGPAEAEKRAQLGLRLLEPFPN